MGTLSIEVDINSLGVDASALVEDAMATVFQADDALKGHLNASSRDVAQMVERTRRIAKRYAEVVGGQELAGVRVIPLIR